MVYYNQKDIRSQAFEEVGSLFHFCNKKVRHWQVFCDNIGNKHKYVCNM